MKMSNELMEKIMQAVEEHNWSYEVLAIRVQEAPFELGKIDHVSHIWDDGTDTGEELSGICGQRVTESAKVLADCYYGDHIALIGGFRYEYGEDRNEVIIADAEVLEIFA